MFTFSRPFALIERLANRLEAAGQLNGLIQAQVLVVSGNPDNRIKVPWDLNGQVRSMYTTLANGQTDSALR